MDFPTNFTPQKDGTITKTCIDLILSNEPELIASVKSAGHLGKSKHVILDAEIIIPCIHNKSEELIPDYNKANFGAMIDDLSTVDWSTTLYSCNTNEAWQLIKDKINAIVESNIPKRKRRLNNRPLWMRQNIIRVIRKKKRLWKWYCSTQEYEDYQAYLRIAASVSKIIKRAKKDLERKLAKEAKSKPKPFYKYVNNSTKVKSKVGPLKDVKGNLLIDDNEILQELNNTFSSSFTVEDTSHLPDPTNIFSGNFCLSSVHITDEMVLKKLKKLDPNKSPGPDKFHPKVVKELAQNLAMPLSIVFNKSLTEGVVPVDWRIANVTAVFKKGDKTSASNYRPISLTSIICRVMESLLRDVIFNHLSRHSLIRSSQHGFTPHKSCLTNLLEFMEVITDMLDQGYNVDMVYLDFARAFDKVPHARLMIKIRALGITGNIANWIEAWLRDRKQRVVLNGQQSSWKSVTSGVPQGSVLGPCLFVIFINDIDTAVDTLTVIKKFADDSKLAKAVNNLEQRDSLQQTLNFVFKWSQEWQMLFNTDKCVVMHLGSNNLQYEYTLNDIPLKTTNVEKDLGVYMHSSMKPSYQVAEAAKKANQILGQILRAFSYRDKVHFVNLYKQRVRCHLEYCIQAWSPWLQQDIELLESVQKRAVRCISGLSGTYEEKLQHVGLTTLYDRRKRGDQIQTFKIMNHIDDVDYRTWFVPISDKEGHQTRQSHIIVDNQVMNTKNISVPKAKTDIRHNFFSHRVVNTWNKLPHCIKVASTTNEFKELYDRHIQQ